MFRLAFPYLLFGLLLALVLADRLGEDTVGPGRDPVCRMDVDGAISAEVDGHAYVFCTEWCRDTFLASPRDYVEETCLVCRVDQDELLPVEEDAPEFTWQGTTYRFCGVAHRDLFGRDPAGYFVHSMWGLPSWLYAVSVGIVLVLSFGLFEILARRMPTHRPRVNLFRSPLVARALRSSVARSLAQAAFLAIFALVVLAGLYGSQIASRNIAPLLVWTIWWGGLVVVILFASKAWCYVCPWDALASLVEKLGLGRSGIRWPKLLRNVWPATMLFVGLTWLELGFGVTMRPRLTALLGLAMVTMAVLAVVFFERRAFCRYACLVGRVSGLYALFSSTEVRPEDRDVCRACATKDCYHGNDRGPGCPTGIFPGALSENTYCIDCMACTRTCPSGNMVVNLRPWGADLADEGRPRRDEAYLALLMLAITGFHGLTMTRVWRDLMDALQRHVAYVPAFSLGMAALMLGPVLVYAGLVWLTVKLGRNPAVRYERAFVRFAYSVLPIALFYHLAHNAEHLLMEGQKIVPLLSNPFGFASGEHWSVLGFAGTGPWNLFGTVDWNLPPLVSLPTLWLVQVLLVLVGHVYSLWIAHRTARRLFPAPGAAFRSQLPMLLGMVLFSIFSLWLLKQPMEMRTSAM